MFMLLGTFLGGVISGFFTGRIKVETTRHAGVGVDTPADVIVVEKLLRNMGMA